MKKISSSAQPRAYSYVRFSTPDQMRGDSFRRQTEAAARYAATHGLTLDDTFTFHDLGVSAFQGKNRAEGMLGEFLAFVRSGDIPKGSYLLVENLDRISRENALDALDTLKDIAREGVTVVTLNDGREFTHESLRRNPIDLMVAVMMFMRANEESETKSRRLSASWENKRSEAGTTPLTSVSPAWVRLKADRSGFELMPERAEVVRRIFRMTLDGLGQHAITGILVREGIPVFGRGKLWHRSYVSKILRNPATVGEFTPHRYSRVDGKRVRTPTDPIQNYYPAVIDRETFERVGDLTSGRAAAGSTSAGASRANILAGLAKCPLCDRTMTRVNKGSRKKAGKPYLVCTSAKVGAGCEYHQVRLEYVHTAIIGKAEELIAEMPSPDDSLQTQWQTLEGEIWGLDEGIAKIVEAIGEAGHSRALLDRLTQLESKLDGAKKEQLDIASRISSSLTNRVQNVAYVELMGAIEAEDVGRINATLRQLFRKAVVNYQTGKLEMYWKHVPGEVSEVFYTMPLVVGFD
ncbi:recombinase family protein [Agrobacterium sp. NPDC090273]|uniref:recombinase family protein n=1 Tax=Agrobacterium sp. NPDC090273 TaxID=3363919 RepID=UPI00383A6BA6